MTAVRTISCIGANDIGILTCFVIASKCPEIRVIVLDKPEIISEWNSDNLPSADSEIQDIVKKCRNRNLFFNSDYPSAIRNSEIIFISLKGTVKSHRNDDEKSIDLKQIEEVSRKITTYADSKKIVVEKSTTPFKVAERISLILQSTCEPGIRIDVLSNPDFPKEEGTIVQSLLSPDMVLIGCARTPSGKAAAQVLSSVYERWIPQKNISFIVMSAAEEIKLAGTALLVQRAATAMAMARVARETGAQLKDIRRFVGLDAERKIYGDIKNLMNICQCLKVPEVADFWETVKNKHKIQENTFFDKFKPIQNRCITVLGISKSSEISPEDPTPIETCKWLLSEKASVNVCDPKLEAKQLLKILNQENVDESNTHLTVHDDVYKAVENSSILIMYSTFHEYPEMNFAKVFKLMSQPKTFLSGVAIQEEEEDQLKRIGFEYHCLWKED